MENVYRRQEHGEARLVAARNGSREVSFPVIATTAALVAVMVPLSLMSGDTGRLFREFAISLAVAIAISMFVALTLVPMLCARFLTVKERRGVGVGRDQPRHRRAARRATIARSARRSRAPRRGRAVRGGAAGFAGLLPHAPEHLPAGRGSRPLHHRDPHARGRDHRLHEAGARAGRAAVPRGARDRGLLRRDRHGLRRAGRARRWPWCSAASPTGTKREREAAGAGGPSSSPSCSQMPEALVFAINPPSLSRRTQSDVEIVIKSPLASLEELAEVSDALVTRLRAVPGLVNVDSDLRLSNPQLDVAFDRDRAADVGVPVRVAGREPAPARRAGPRRRVHPAQQAVRRGDGARGHLPQRARAARRGARARARRRDGAARRADRHAAEDRALDAEPLQPRARSDPHREPGARRDARRGARARRGAGGREPPGRLLDGVARHLARVPRVVGADLRHLRPRAARDLSRARGAVRELRAPVSR